MLVARFQRDSQLGKRPTEAAFSHSRAFPQTSQVDGANFSFDGLLCLTITSVCHFSRLVSSECGPDSEVTYPKKALATRHIPTPSYALHLGYRHSCTSHPWEQWCSICITLLLSTTHPLFFAPAPLSPFPYVHYLQPPSWPPPPLPLLAFGMQSRTLKVFPPPRPSPLSTLGAPEVVWSLPFFSSPVASGLSPTLFFLRFFFLLLPLFRDRPPGPPNPEKPPGSPAPPAPSPTSGGGPKKSETLRPSSGLVVSGPRWETPSRRLDQAVRPSAIGVPRVSKPCKNGRKTHHGNWRKSARNKHYF